MEIKITIEKKYVWILVVLILAVGLVVAYKSGKPAEVLGHSFEELEGVAPNCEVANNPVCDGPRQISQWYMKGTTAFAALAWDAQRLDGKMIRIGSETFSINNANHIEGEITYSPPCPYQYRVFMTATRMTGNNAIYLPVLANIVDADTFRLVLWDVDTNSWTGDVKVDYLVVCS